MKLYFLLNAIIRFINYITDKHTRNDAIPKSNVNDYTNDGLGWLAVGRRSDGGSHG